MADKEKIIEKIQKLFTMSEKGTENERKTALIKAQKMLLDHRLELAEVFGYKNTENIVFKQCSNKINLHYSWIDQLTNIVAQNFRCRIAYNHQSGHKGKLTQCTIIGYAVDAEICEKVVLQALEMIEIETKGLVNYYYRKFGNTKGVKQDYIDGFLKGIKDGFYEQLISNNQYALVAQVPEEVNEMVNSWENINLLQKNIESMGNLEVHQAGYLKGNKFAKGQDDDGIETTTGWILEGGEHDQEI